LEYLRDIRAYKCYFIVLCFLSLTVALEAQEDYAKKDLINNIQQIGNVIDTKNEEISNTIKNYNLLQSKIDTRKALVGYVQGEKQKMESTLDSMSAQVKEINGKLGVLRKEYGKILKLNYMQSLTEQRWAYILSSSTLLEGYKKWIFSKQYKDLLNTQKDALYANLEALDVTMSSMKRKMAKKESLIQEENVQTGQLEKDRSEQKRMLTTLKKNEGKVRQDLEKKNAVKKQMREEIETVIVAEHEQATPAAGLDFNPSLSRKIKGTLPWPIENAVVTGRYGKHPHPSLKHVEILNNGIDLAGGDNKSVRLVFDGEVVGRKKLADTGIMIIVKHGNYYSVYSKIVIANVRAGDKVSQGTVIGSVQDELHFEIWQGKEKLNPIHWLTKRNI